MKTNRIIKNLAALALLSAFSLQPSALLGQGSLTPPGPPAPTMKSADEIYAKLDPRTIVNATNTPGNSGYLFIISQPGSYYLTTNLVGLGDKSGIKIAANNVTLDLNGFALQGGSAGYAGIYIPGAQTNITVRNGTISDWQYFGVDSISSSSFNLVCERLNVCASWYGIAVGGAGVVRDCNCESNYIDGISCFVGGIVSGCTAINNGTYGILVYSGTVSGCTANNNGNSGIYDKFGTVSGCNVYSNGISGIVVGDGNAVIGNTCIGNGTLLEGQAIFIVGSNNRVDDNHCMASGYAGIQVAAGSGFINNIIIKNSVFGSGANNYIIPVGQIVGPIITNTVSGIITNSNPWANFSF